MQSQKQGISILKSGVNKSTRYPTMSSLGIKGNTLQRFNRTKLTLTKLKEQGWLFVLVSREPEHHPEEKKLCLTHPGLHIPHPELEAVLWGRGACCNHPHLLPLGHLDFLLHLLCLHPCQSQKQPSKDSALAIILEIVSVFNLWRNSSSSSSLWNIDSKTLLFSETGALG